MNLRREQNKTFFAGLRGSAFMLTTLSLAFLSAQVQAQPTDRPWNTLQCSSENRRDAEAYITYTRARLAEAETYVRGCEGSGYYPPATPSTTFPTTPGINNDCLQYMVAKSYGLDTAKKSCDGLLGTEFDCMKTVIEKGTSPKSARAACAGLGPIAQDCMAYSMGKGSGPATARKNCDGLTEISFQCVRYMADKSYGAQTAKTTCAGISETGLECLRTLIEKGYGPAKAKATCTSSTAP